MNKVLIENKEVKISNPDKILWPSLNITKMDYISILTDLAPYILPHAYNRLLTTIRYPDGVDGKSFYQKNIPSYAPEWVEHQQYKSIDYILLNSKPTLSWLANQAALEFHTSFNLTNNLDHPTSLVFDLDPAKDQPFSLVAEIALLIKETLDSLAISSWIKTSGATGLQIYIPIGNKYNYSTARKINNFFGKYFSEKYPKLITIERLVKKRDTKLYFDYLQMWHGKTITMVYSPRATQNATVSTPIEWHELNEGINPDNFNLLNIRDRLFNKGDLFAPLLKKESVQNLDLISIKL